MRNQKKTPFPKIRIPVSVPPSRVHESKVKPVSRAKMRRKSKKEVKEGLTGF